MKFLLVPLLIIGMFVSFTAALIAMLFFTKTVQTPQDLVQLVLGGPDSTKVFDEFLLKEDRLDDLFQLAEEYKTRYEEQAKLNENCWIPHGDRIAKMIRSGYFWNPDHMPH